MCILITKPPLPLTLIIVSMAMHLAIDVSSPPSGFHPEISVPLPPPPTIKINRVLGYYFLSSMIFTAIGSLRGIIDHMHHSTKNTCFPPLLSLSLSFPYIIFFLFFFFFRGTNTLSRKKKLSGNHHII